MTEILSLSTIVERATLNIDSKQHPKGKLYELLGLDDLGPVSHQKLAKAHAAANNLIRSDKELTPQQERALDKALGDIVRTVAPTIEPVVLKALTTAQRVKIMLAWSAANTGEPEDPPTPPIGGASSRASKSSTVATRKRGGTRRSGS